MMDGLIMNGLEKKMPCSLPQSPKKYRLTTVVANCRPNTQASLVVQHNNNNNNNNNHNSNNNNLILFNKNDCIRTTQLVSSHQPALDSPYAPIGTQFTTVQTTPNPINHIVKTANYGSTLDAQVLAQENKKLATIARLCIHLVDRCRTLNKSKQFTEDMFKLGNLIDEFNRSNTRKDSSLPSFGNSGLVFANTNQNNTVELVTNSTANTGNNNNNNGMIFIPIQTQAGNSAKTLIQQYITTGDKMVTERNNKAKQGKKLNGSQQNEHTLQQQQQLQHSILFKKLTESSQIINTELSKDLQTNVNTLTIPLNINDQNEIFSIVNQIDNSNIENTPNIADKSNTKAFRCEICTKMFANSYNLSRHMRSHSGFQPYECVYPDCRKRFNYNYHLKRHMETHTGERPFVCTWPDCDQRFNRKYNLNRHLWIHTEHKNKSNMT